MNRFKGKNILCIYYKFPPIKGIGTIRNLRFYHSLKSEARKIFVLTTTNRHFLPQDEYNYLEKDVIEVPTVDYRSIYHFFTGKRSSLIVPDNAAGSSRILRFRKWFKDSILSRFMDEGGSYYVNAGVKIASKIIEEQGVDIIISSYSPFDSHLMAWKLKKKYPNLYWIADYRDFIGDPMLTNMSENSYLFKKNRQLLKDVDEVITVSQGLKERIDLYHDHVKVVRNGIDASLLPQQPISKYDLFTLAYTGIIYPHAQKADLLGRALSNLISSGHIEVSHLQFMHAGKDVMFWRSILEKYGLGQILVNHGIVPHKEALEIQRKSHVNLLLSWSSDKMKGILTGKLFEYIASGSPILALVNGIRDEEVENIISGHGFGKVFYHKESELPALESYIFNLYQQWQYRLQQPRINTVDHQKITSFLWETGFNRWANNQRNSQSLKNSI
ncbi:glycosyltransferase family protein [Membranihabitans marinus]|uniref:hypothetical protein n=1 Tax=Membranihabitans marinus TaxID=1227546 RepID=UPI001F459477|nr:hypothetical protein [Membranihabitans marinus]